MHLTPREQERLLLAAAADLARRRLARGAPLGATEAIALVCDEICEMAWDGVDLAEVIERARAIIPATALLPGVAALAPVLEVEALFPWGSTLVHVDAPFGQDQAQDHPERTRPALAPVYDSVPGEIRAAAGDIALALGTPRRPVVLRNTGPRDVWISSHFPLDQVNPAITITFADEAETGCVPPPDTGAPNGGEATPAGGGRTASPLTGSRLDLPAGEALLLRPGQRSAHLAVIREWGDSG